jgi:hypothetical protein
VSIVNGYYCADCADELLAKRGVDPSQGPAAALLRAQLSLKHALERIDFAEDVVKPKLEEIRQIEATQKVTLEIEEGDLA